MLGENYHTDAGREAQHPASKLSPTSRSAATFNLQPSSPLASPPPGLGPRSVGEGSTLASPLHDSRECIYRVARE